MPDKKKAVKKIAQKPAKKATPKYLCPWCKTMPKVNWNDDYWTSPNKKRYFVQCGTPKCKVNPTTNDYSRRRDAVKAWDVWGGWKKTK